MKRNETKYGFDATLCKRSTGPLAYPPRCLSRTEARAAPLGHSNNTSGHAKTPEDLMTIQSAFNIYRMTAEDNLGYGSKEKPCNSLCWTLKGT